MPTVAIAYDESIVPSVKIDVTGITIMSGTTRITITRKVDDETYTVRNANAVDISGSASFYVQDFEVPLAAMGVYYATITNGTTTESDSQTFGPFYSSSDAIWISDPLVPSTFVKVTTTDIGDTSGNMAILGKGSMSEITRSYDRAVSYVLGKTKPVLQFYGQKSIAGLAFDIIAAPTARDQVNALLASGHVLFRASSRRFTTLPRALYCTLAGSQEPLTWQLKGTEFDETNDLTRWKLTLDEVQAQSTDIVYSPYSYNYYTARAPLYSNALAYYGGSSYLYAMKNPLP